MWVARLTAFLLPLGIWLVLSAASPRSQEARIAASGIGALAVSVLLYFAAGFAFMFGGVGTVSALPELSRFVTYFTLPVDNQTWGMIGLRGFFLDGVATGAPFNLS